MGHPFFIHTYSLLQEMQKCEEENNVEKAVLTAKLLKKSVDYLFVSFAQAEGIFDHEDSQRIGDTLRLVKINWGSWLATYIDDEMKKIKKESK